MSESTVFLVEDFQPLRDSMTQMLHQAGIPCEAFASPDGLLSSFDFERAGCLVLDLHLPGMTGLELQCRLWETGCRLPFLIVSGHCQVPDATTAFRRGAVDFLEKPFTREMFLDRVREAIRKDEGLRQKRSFQQCTRSRLEKLTVREREILDLILDCRLNKQIAKQLDLSIKTVENHRSNITKKMGADSTIQLVKTIAEYRAA